MKLSEAIAAVLILMTLVLTIAVAPFLAHAALLTDPSNALTEQFDGWFLLAFEGTLMVMLWWGTWSVAWK